MKRILITGGSGFVGRNLIEQLGNEYCLFAPRHKELDVLDTEALIEYVRKNKIDQIIHSAIHVGMFNGYENIFLNDMLMFANIEKVSHEVEKVIYFGSGAEYDKSSDITMVREEQIGQRVPTSDYGLAKYLMNMIARRSNNIYNFRLFGIFGKYELWDIKFISNVICKTLYDLPITIRKECSFDYLYIDDLVKVVRWCIENEPIYHDYNVCMGKPYKLSELVNIVMNNCRKKIDYEYLSAGVAFDYTADNKRLVDEIGDNYLTPMEDAIAKLTDFYRTHINEIDYNKLKESK